MTTGVAEAEALAMTVAAPLAVVVAAAAQAALLVVVQLLAAVVAAAQVPRVRMATVHKRAVIAALVAAV
ncbi:MAG: hypothetical protein JWR15_1258, partial [Prosthecobacter sp.]|nr:hypothetical protein [Prosthecobacter sp.]